MNNIEKYVELHNEVTRASDELHKFISDNKSTLIIDLAKEMKKIPGLNKIIVKGYTPGFNDGDPCTHSSEVYFNKRWHFSELSEYGIDNLSSFLGAPEEYEDELYEWEGLDSVNTYSDEDEEKIEEFISMLDDLVERLYYTDYIVYIDLTGDEPVINSENYECGY